MRKLLMIAMAIAITLIPLTGEAKKKKNTKQDNPLGNMFEIEHSEHDTDEYFGATGFAYGELAKMDELQKKALTNAQDMIRQKMKHHYKGFVTNYSSSVNNDIISKAQRKGEQIIEGIVNDVNYSQGPFFKPDDKGNIMCIMTIRIPKKDLADNISKSIINDDELKLQFEEEQFSKRMDEAFKKYKEDNQ